jgi:hypothetical protein
MDDYRPLRNLANVSKKRRRAKADRMDGWMKGKTTSTFQGATYSGHFRRGRPFIFMLQVARLKRH